MCIRDSYKSDELGDPLLCASHLEELGVISPEYLEEAMAMAKQVNQVLQAFFAERGLALVDFKLEFGVFSDGSIVLGDEFSPDGCRLWDKETRKKMDKDRFRQGLGDVIEAYEEVAQRLGVPL